MNVAYCAQVASLVRHIGEPGNQVQPFSGSDFQSRSQTNRLISNQTRVFYANNAVARSRPRLLMNLRMQELCAVLCTSLALDFCLPARSSAVSHVIVRRLSHHRTHMQNLVQLSIAA